jgi:ATP phosphoribosyltransferase
MVLAIFKRDGYLDSRSKGKEGMPESQKLSLAVPKGRIMQMSIELLHRVGLSTLSLHPYGIFRRDIGKAWIIAVRNWDVPTYVDRGVVDAAIVGKDVLLESGSTAYECLDLGFACCRLSLICPRGAKGSIRRVASKYPHITRKYLQHIGNDAEVIKLNGNVELACLTELADAVVDVIETGNTLLIHDLEEIDVIMESSARFVINRTAFEAKSQQLDMLIAALRHATQNPLASPVGQR